MGSPATPLAGTYLTKLSANRAFTAAITNLRSMTGLSPIYASFAATLLAVIFGILAYLADRRGSRIDPWQEAARERPVSQADRIRGGGRRNDERTKARAFTLVSGAWWLCGGLFATAASLSTNRIAADGAYALAFLALAGLGTDYVLRRSSLSDFTQRANMIQGLTDLARDPNRPALSVEEQLHEWADNPDLLVFVQHRVDGPTAITYQGQLALQRVGVGGWILQAPDWHIGPLDSVSNLRGMALNLHHFTENRWGPGNGVFGSSCSFYRRDSRLHQAPNGQIIQMNGIVETLVVRIDDPFEIMPFL